MLTQQTTPAWQREKGINKEEKEKERKKSQIANRALVHTFTYVTFLLKRAYGLCFRFLPSLLFGWLF